MIRALFLVGLSAVSLGGCADAQKIEDLETRLAALEAKVEKSGGAQRGGPAAGSPEDQAAAELLKEASQAAKAMNFDEAKAKLAELKEKYAESRAARSAARLESELAIIGKPASDLQVEKWYQGEVANIDGPTLLVFWELWCPHCKREVPRLGEVSEKFGPRGLTVLGLTKQTRGTTDEQIEGFIKDNKVSYPIAKEAGDAMSQHYGVRGIPAAAMVLDGKVVWRGHPAGLTDDAIKGWLGG